MIRSVSVASRRHGERGSVLIEFTLSATFLLTMFLGTLQFGYGFYMYSQLEAAVRAGARYASMRTYNAAPLSNSSSTPTADFTTAVQNVVVYGNPAPPDGATPVVPGLTTSNVSLTVTFASVPTAMTVSITGYSIPSYFGNQTLNGKPTTTFPFVGVYGPP